MDNKLLTPQFLAAVFDIAPDQLWRSILRRKGGYYKLLADMPEDVSLN